jgi:hypothetical protein
LLKHLSVPPHEAIALLKQAVVNLGNRLLKHLSVPPHEAIALLKQAVVDLGDRGKDLHQYF